MLQAEAQRWLGTPFMPYQGVRGGGCDCIHLVHGILKGCGFPHEFKPPAYTLDATAHRDDSMLLDYLDRMDARGSNQMIG